MYKKSVLIFILIIVNSIISFGQEKKTVLNAPKDWKSEIIPFPLGFAQQIDFVGFEDIRFAPKWNDSGSEEFWTYTFVWYIEKYGAMTESKLTETFSSYYNGLMGVDIANQSDTTKSNQLDETLCLFVKTNEGFSGKMRVYDRFFTKDYVILPLYSTFTSFPMVKP